MFIHITDSETGSNKGSCAALVNYLEKENRAIDLEDNTKLEKWFSGSTSGHALQITPQEVRVNIDNNIAKLSKADAKFFLINISPSEKEILWLKEKFGDQGAQEKLKSYAIAVMDAYAGNFKRPGIKDNTDLLWYGKLERNRYYRYDDSDVKEGLVKQGDLKPGEQLHIQIIVSRKDITNMIKLSPMNNSKGKNAVHSGKLGQFDRKAFKASGEAIFDELFGYNREVKDTIEYAITMSKGSADEKKALYELRQTKTTRTDTNDNTFGQHWQQIPDAYPDNSLEQALNVFSISSGLLSGLLPSEHEGDDQKELITFPKKKKKQYKPR